LNTRYGFIGLILLFFCGFSNAGGLNVQPFDEGTWNEIQAQHEGQEWLVQIWAVSCSACMQELPIWAKYIDKHKNDHVIFVQADAASLDRTQVLLQQMGFKAGKHYSATHELEDQLRFSVHPSWQGETPATLIIHRNGKKEWVLGAMNEKQISQALKETASK